MKIVSIINDWKEILTKMPKIILAEIEEKSTKKTLFKNNIGAFGYGFNIQSNLNNLFINITIDLSYKPEDLSCILSLKAKSGLEISIGGSIDSLIVGGGAEAYISFGNFKYQYNPVLDFYNFENRIEQYINYQIPHLGFRVYVYHSEMVIKCTFLICYPWLEEKTEYLVNIHTDTKDINKTYSKNIEICDKSQILEKEKNNEELMEENKKWIQLYYN